MNILVVEDSQAIRDLLRHMLEEQGHNVVCLSNGQDVLEVLKGIAFDLVITDKNLPGLSGLDLIKIIQQIQKDLPIILITGERLDSNLLPGVSIITKPFTLKVIARAINDLAKNRGIFIPQKNYRRINSEVVGS